MTTRKGEENIILEDLDYIKTIQAVEKYMNFGVSGYKDSNEKTLYYKMIQNKFIESQNKIEDHLNIIETIADNQPTNRKRGELFEGKNIKIINKNFKKKSKINFCI